MPTITERALAIFSHIGFQGRRENKQHAELESLFDDVSQVLSRTTTITAAQLASIYDTPFEIVPAPGVNKIIVPLQMEFAFITPDPNGLENFVVPAWGDDGIYIFTGDGGQIRLDTSLDNLSIFPRFGEEFESEVYTVSLSYANQHITLSQFSSNPVCPAAIQTSTIGAAGTGYVEDDVVTIGDATLTVLTVGGGGEVLTYEVTDAGTNNIIGNTQATTGGSGTGFTVNITALDYSVNPMTLKVKVLYSVFDLS